MTTYKPDRIVICHELNILKIALHYMSVKTEPFSSFCPIQCHCWVVILQNAQKSEAQHSLPPFGVKTPNLYFNNTDIIRETTWVHSYLHTGLKLEKKNKFAWLHLTVTVIYLSIFNKNLVWDENWKIHFNINIQFQTYNIPQKSSTLNHVILNILFYV